MIHDVTFNKVWLLSIGYLYTYDMKYPKYDCSTASGSGGSVPQKVRDILSGVLAGNRAKLAEAITLGTYVTHVISIEPVSLLSTCLPNFSPTISSSVVESKHSVKHRQAQWLLTEVLSHRSKQRQLGQLKPSFRLGVSGPPGAGKSTVIEKLGQLLTGQGYRVAVLVSRDLLRSPIECQNLW